uniref:Uncharacterized protein n=1 Tax=Helianthus annuus TaxID=4232 RepID=A0A251UGQ5_HELAN
MFPICSVPGVSGSVQQVRFSHEVIRVILVWSTEVKPGQCVGSAAQSNRVRFRVNISQRVQVKRLRSNSVTGQHTRSNRVNSVNNGQTSQRPVNTKDPEC